ncbi:MAG: hypothetical protein WA991_00635 [Ornithinimicrobium sp.]
MVAIKRRQDPEPVEPTMTPVAQVRPLSGPEHQKVRLPTIEALTALSWSKGQLQWQPEWRVPKAPNEASKREGGSSFSGYPVDLVLFDDEQHAGSWEHVVVIFEFKAPNLTAGLSQLETYLNHEPRARMGYWTNGSEDVRVYRLPNGTYKHFRGHGLPQPGENFSQPTDRPLKYADLKTPDVAKLTGVFERLLDDVDSQPVAVVFYRGMVIWVTDVMQCAG